jgi:hypothetical protein
VWRINIDISADDLADAAASAASGEGINCVIDQGQQSMAVLFRELCWANFF